MILTGTQEFFTNDDSARCGAVRQTALEPRETTPLTRSLLALISVGLFIAPAALFAAEWKPERYVEIISNTSPGGTQDLFLRTIQNIWQERGLTSQVINKPGGAGIVASNYLTQHARDPHYVMILTPTIFTSRLMGYSNYLYTDFTPLALLASQGVGVSVRADSPIKNGKDLIERLRKDPSSLSIAVSTTIGNHMHMGLALPMRAAGVDVKKMKIVAHKSANDSVTNLLGGHIDVVISSYGVMLPHLSARRVRMIGVSTSQRLPGALANVPTWKEQGANAVVSNWYGIVGAQGINAAQVAYWDAVFAALTISEEWRKDLEKNLRDNHYMNSSDVRKFWDTQYVEWKEILTELGLTKRTD